MISIEAYRIVIGTFSNRGNLKHSGKSRQLNVDPFNDVSMIRTLICHKIYNVIIWITMFAIIFCCAFLKTLRHKEFHSALSTPTSILVNYLTMYPKIISPRLVCSLVFILMDVTCFNRFLLLRSGDIEVNPGPTYRICKVVQGTSHQGDIKYGNYAGIQCATCALVSICWSLVKKPGFWTHIDIDRILDMGTRTFETVGLARSLDISELPRRITYGDYEFIVTVLGTVNDEITHTLSFFTNSFASFKSCANGFLLFVDQFTIALIWANNLFFCLIHIVLMRKDIFILSVKVKLLF